MFEKIKKVYSRIHNKSIKNGHMHNNHFIRFAINTVNPELKGQATKLHLGCGSNIKKGWLNCDLVTTDSVPQETFGKIKDIFIMDATEIFPFREQQFSFIYSEDFLEHFDQKEGLAICAECYRVLSPGGILRISTPGFDKIIKEMKPRCRVDINFGHWGWGHKLLYTEFYMRSLLTGCGYVDIRTCRFGESRHPEIWGIDTRTEQADLNLIVEAMRPEPQKAG